MKTGDNFIVERCATGYIVHAHNSTLEKQCWPVPGQMNAFSHKEHVLDFLRKNLTFDVECGLAKEQKK